MENINLEMVKENSVVKFINEDKAFFNGKVMKVDKNYLGIVINTKQSTYQEFKKNENVGVLFIYENEVIRSTATIIASKLGEDEQAIIIDVPNIVIRIERREYSRVDIVMDVEYSKLPEEVEYTKLSMVETMYFRHHKKAYTVDMSAGGVNIVTSIDEKDSKFILLAFSISNKKIITLCGMIRSEPMVDKKQKKIAYKFLDIGKSDRQLILDFVNSKTK